MDELKESRETNQRLNRRCQRLESEIRRLQKSDENSLKAIHDITRQSEMHRRITKMHKKRNRGKACWWCRLKYVFKHKVYGKGFGFIYYLRMQLAAWIHPRGHF